MNKIKEFVGNHKKAIIIAGATVGVLGLGVVAYKLKFNGKQAIEAIAEVSEAVDPEVVVETITNNI